MRLKGQNPNYQGLKRLLGFRGLAFTILLLNLLLSLNFNIPVVAETVTSTIGTNIIEPQIFLNFGNFDSESFLAGKPGPLKNLKVEVIDGASKDSNKEPPTPILPGIYSAGNLIDKNTYLSKIDARVVLAFLETRYTMVTDPTVEPKIFIQGGSNKAPQSFEGQLGWLVSSLREAYVAYSSQFYNSYFYTFQDGSKLSVPTSTNASTYAILSVLASTTSDQAKWLNWSNTNGFKAIYLSFLVN